MFKSGRFVNNTRKKFDIYISLRTYNSSFFDIYKASEEANRILKNDGIIIISLANGFLNTQNNSIIPGLIIPRTNFVDIYRGLDTIKKLANKFKKLDYKEIKIFPKNSEIYIIAKK